MPVFGWKGAVDRIKGTWIRGQECQKAGRRTPIFGLTKKLAQRGAKVAVGRVQMRSLGPEFYLEDSRPGIGYPFA